MIRDFWILLNEKYQRNKSVIWFIIAVVVLFILVMRNFDKVSNSHRGSSETTTSESVSYDKKIRDAAVKSEDNYDNVKENLNGVSMKKEDCIKLFVQLCNNGKIQAAYDCLSDFCKQELYPTKQKFIDDYYGVIFKISKECEITEVKNDTYKVKYTNDSISTGGNSEGGEGIVDYITYDTAGKISISGLIKVEEPKITSIAPYFTVYVDKIKTYSDKIIYDVRVKNNTKADIYINDEDNSNLYVRDDSNGIISVDTSGLFDSDYLVTGGSIKSFTLTVNSNAFDRNSISELCFGNMIIKNKEYLDTTTEVVNSTTGQKEYVRRKTNYPETYNWSIKFEN